MKVSGQVQVQAPALLSPRKWAPVPVRQGGWDSPRAGFDACPYRKSQPDLLVNQPFV